MFALMSQHISGDPLSADSLANLTLFNLGVRHPSWHLRLIALPQREFIDYETSMITDEEPLAGVAVLPGSQFLSHTTRHHFI